MIDRAIELRQRLKDLPDQEDELLSYLPSRSAGDQKAGLSAHDIARAEAICRRLVAVHCLYGVDLNPLAVELAKLSLWIESHAEGFLLTFLDHRIVLGNSLTGRSGTGWSPTPAAAAKTISRCGSKGSSPRTSTCR